MVEEESVGARVDAQARETAFALIESFIGPDHKVLNMEGFVSALVQALKDARELGQEDRSGEVADYP